MRLLVAFAPIGVLNFLFPPFAIAAVTWKRVERAPGFESFAIAAFSGEVVGEVGLSGGFRGRGMRCHRNHVEDGCLLVLQVS